MEKKTPLYDCHLEAGGRMVPYAGYLLPVQYTEGIIAEHMAVRTRAGMFDVTHMGEVLYTGPDALKNLNYLLTNDFTNMADGQVRYSPMCNERGGIVDDLIVYKFDDSRYMVVVNAGNHEKDAAWMREHLFGDVEFSDISDTVAQIALQGPSAPEILSRLGSPEDIPERYYHFKPFAKLAGIPCTVSRTGYTGELGFEIYLDNGRAPELWNKLLEAGAEFGLIPCGLGARDTLRLEAAMPLYGHEMDDNTTPLETGLGFAVKMAKEDFIGRAAMEVVGSPSRCRVGLRVVGKGIIREDCPLFAGDAQIGRTTSGTLLPYLGYAGAMALVDAGYGGKIGQVVEAEVRGRRVFAEIVALPFYSRQK